LTFSDSLGYKIVEANAMKETLKVVKELEKVGVIKAYAIGGGIAATYYIEPVLTFDLDIFFIPVQERIDILTPIYEHLREKGFRPRQEQVLIEGIPVQFIPAFNALIEEAVRQAKAAAYQRLRVNILRIEHLIAIGLQTFRPKDRERIVRLLEEAEVDHRRLHDILKNHGLLDKYKKFKDRQIG
jgi:hypothetical protein